MSSKIVRRSSEGCQNRMEQSQISCSRDFHSRIIPILAIKAYNLPAASTNERPPTTPSSSGPPSRRRFKSGTLERTFSARPLVGSSQAETEEVAEGMSSPIAELEN